MRDPAIHIKRSVLLKLLKDKLSEGEVDALLFKAVKFTLRNRVMVTAGAKGKKKAQRLVDASSDHTAKFNGILTSVRQAKGHQRITAIRQGDREYIMLAEVAAIAVEFAAEFKLPIAEGMKEFVEIGLQLMGRNYGLSKYKYYKVKIFDLYEFAQVVENDPDREATKKFYQTWQTVLCSYSAAGLKLDRVEDFVHMVFGRMEAEEAGATYKHWITAQFEGLSWLNAMPELSQLYGNNAKKRYDKYMVTQGWSKESADETIPTKFASEDERQYWAMLKEKRASNG